MGDFSVTCFISGLPIASGHRVIGVPMRKARYKDPQFPYGPVGIPVSGTQGDYGTPDKFNSTIDAAVWFWAHHDLFLSAAEVFDDAWKKENRYEKSRS